MDQQSRRLIDNVVNEDDILNENITREWKCSMQVLSNSNLDIEQIEQRRPVNRDMDAVYILSAQPHIVDCVLADMERRRYRRMFLMWTSCTSHISTGEKLVKLI